MNQSNPNAPPSAPQMLPLSRLHTFQDHPYRVSDDEEMSRLCESIRQHGVLSPILVRLDDEGYEIVSGHRRVFACRKLGLDTIPAVVQEMSRDEAVLKMVDSNLHREHLLPSEKAFAYKMKLDALKHQGQTLSQAATKSDSAEEIGAQVGESRDVVYRYIRLTNLIPPLLDLVDAGRIAFMPAERLSYLTPNEQTALAGLIDELDATPSFSQACRLKELSQAGQLTESELSAVMEHPKANQRETVKLDADELRAYFPDQTPRQMRVSIMKILEEKKTARRMTPEPDRAPIKKGGEAR